MREPRWSIRPARWTPLRRGWAPPEQDPSPTRQRRRPATGGHQLKCTFWLAEPSPFRTGTASRRPVMLEIMRDGKSREVEVKLGRRPDEMDQARRFAPRGRRGK